MARRGRKRKIGEREASGKLLRPTREQMEIARRSASDAEKVIVLMQPHRNGDTSQLRGSALGRFVSDHRLDTLLYDAGQEYAVLKSKWLSAWGAPRDERMGGSGRDIDMDVVNAWGTRISEMENAVIRFGVAALGWVEELAFYDRGVPAGEAIETAKRGFMALAVETGRLPPKALDVYHKSVYVRN